MKKILILLGFLCSTAALHADTLDYWTVYLNDSVIGKFNASSEDLDLVIDGSKVGPEDVLSVVYMDDSPCAECACHLFVIDEKKRKLAESRPAEYGSKLRLGLENLIEYGKKNGSERYDFYYQENGSSGPGPMAAVLRMRVR